MALSLKLLMEVPLATLSYVAGNTFWSMLRLPNFLYLILTTKSNLETLLVVPYSGSGAETSLSKEREIGYPLLLLSDVSSSLKAWAKVRNLALVGGIICAILSTTLGTYWAGGNCVIFMLAVMSGIHTGAKGNVFKDVGLMLGRLQRWNKVDEKACEEFCTHAHPKLLSTIYSVVANSSH